MSLNRVVVLGWCVLGWSTTGAAGQERSAAAWRELTLADVEAGSAIISRNHPAAVPATGDSTFRVTLANAIQAARTRAGGVTSYEGWLATLRAFVVSFGDPHISLQTRLSPSSVRWPGLVVGRQGEFTVVVSRDSTRAAELPEVGARLVSCDGIPGEQLGRDRLGVFRGTWDVASQRVRTTPALLVDDGNPFAPPLTHCVFSIRGAESETVLRWRSIATTALQERLRDAAPIGRAGFVVRRAGEGWWIGVEALNDRVKPVLDSVAARLAAIRSAPWVVVDVRGNGGGSSTWGERLASQLVGEARVTEAIRRAQAAMRGELCGTSWRASPDVEETLEGYIRNLGPGLGQGAIDEWRRELDSVKAARAAGRPLGPAPRPCPPAAAPGRPASDLPVSAMTGRLVLLTDHACFSSCLQMAAVFRLIGAIHVGEATDFSTRYMEVRGFPLPSGLGSVATLQKVSFSAPYRLGPYEPAHLYPGRIDDTSGLERWIQQVTARP